MRKFVFVLIAIILCCLILSWGIPIKFSIKYNSLSEISQDNIVLLCTHKGNTGPFWTVEDFYGTDNLPSFDVDITGVKPENVLRPPLYIYANSYFVFVGDFSENNPEVFEAVSWEIVGTIDRSGYVGGYFLIPFPKSYFNIWEISMSKILAK